MLAGALAIIAIAIAALCLCRNSVEREGGVSHKVTVEILETEGGEGTLEEGDTSGKTTRHEQEICTLNKQEINSILVSEASRLRLVKTAPRTEYLHYLLRKYDGWTEERRSQRINELKTLRDSPRPPPPEPWIFVYTPPSEEELELEKLKEAWDWNGRLPPSVANLDEHGAASAWRDSQRIDAMLMGSYSLAYRLHSYPMATKANESLRIVPDQLHDFRDGEIRFPPTTEEFGNLYKVLIQAMNKPELAEDDLEKISQIVQYLKQMVRTNTPTSIFQIPSGAEDVWQEYERQQQEAQRQLDEANEQRQEQFRREARLRERAAQALGDDARYIHLASELAKLDVTIKEKSERYEQEFVTKHAHLTNGFERSAAHFNFIDAAKKQDGYYDLLPMHSELTRERVGMEDVVMERLRADEAAGASANPR